MDSLAQREELAEAGFHDAEIHGIDGCAWLVPDLDVLWEEPAAREALMRTVRLLDSQKDILALSTHVLGITVK